MYPARNQEIPRDGPDTGEEPQIDPDLLENKKLLFTTINRNPADDKPQKVDENKKNGRTEDEVNNYEWLKIIGQGTFGVVYKAQYKPESKIVAIKKVYQDPKYSNREFKIVVELNHPNCIKVHNYFFSNNEEKAEEVYLNLVMDYIPDTLYKILRFYFKKGYPFPNALGKIYTYQMLRALAYIHNLNICHRDIKPQNILVDINTHRLVLCDFGSAKQLKTNENSVSYICSRYYRAPELILGEENYGCDIDIWSIGCVVAEMFLGEPLFCGKNSKDQFVKIMNVFGTPSEQEIIAMCPNVNANLPQIKGTGLKKRFKNPDPLLVDLLNKLLTYPPQKRLKPFEALAHPYFDDLRLQKLTINSRPVTDLFDFTTVEVGKSQSLLGKLVPNWYKKP